MEFVAVTDLTYGTPRWVKVTPVDVKDIQIYAKVHILDINPHNGVVTVMLDASDHTEFHLSSENIYRKTTESW